MDRIPVGTRFSAPLQTGPGAHPASCTMGTESFPRKKSGRGMTLTSNFLLVPWSWKSRAIPLISLWAVRPVQSFIACTMVHFTTFFFLSLSLSLPLSLHQNCAVEPYLHLYNRPTKYFVSHSTVLPHSHKAVTIALFTSRKETISLILLNILTDVIRVFRRVRKIAKSEY